MKRTFFYLLIVTIVAGWLGTLIARDPGYVLVTYDGSTLQTGLWVMLAVLVIFGFGIYYFFRLANIVAGAGRRFQDWGFSRRMNRATELTGRGLIYLQEGNFERAEKFLVSGAADHQTPAVNYIAAARAADARGDATQREAYLRLALGADSGAKLAVAVASAELAGQRGDWRAAISQLAGLPDNSATLALRKDAFLHLQEWQSLLDLIPGLRKLSGESLEELEKQAVVARLDQGLSDEQAVVVFRKASDAVRQSEDAILAFCAAINSEKEAETTLRSALKKSWQARLVEAYGSLGKETLSRRMKTAEAWIKIKPNDASLQFCLGQLYETSGEREKARLAYEKSVEMQNNRRASVRLANLLAFDGDFEKSNEYLRIAINGSHQT